MTNSKSRILIVDDEINLAKLHACFLRSDALDIKTVCTPSLVPDILSSYKPDILITDFHMPILNGCTLACIVRSIPGYERLPILLVTSDCSMTKAELMNQCSISEILYKPIKQQQLVGTVHRLLGEGC